VIPVTVHRDRGGSFPRLRTNQKFSSSVQAIQHWRFEDPVAPEGSHDDKLTSLS
jgi:hypothetical protein